MIPRGAGVAALQCGMAARPSLVLPRAASPGQSELKQVFDGGDDRVDPGDQRAPLQVSIVNEGVRAGQLRVAITYHYCRRDKNSCSGRSEPPRLP